MGGSESCVGGSATTSGCEGSGALAAKRLVIVFCPVPGVLAADLTGIEAAVPRVLVAGLTGIEAAVPEVLAAGLTGIEAAVPEVLAAGLTGIEAAVLATSDTSATAFNFSLS